MMGLCAAFFLLFVAQAAKCNAAGPVVTVGGLHVSGSSHRATVGEPLALSCNTAAAVWKRGSVTISTTDASSRVFVTKGSTEIILNFSPFQTTDGETFTCEFNSTFKTSVTLDPKLPKIHSVIITPGFVGTSPNADPSLEVSWSAVDDPAVSYVVRYSTSQGTLTSPPDGASAMGANDNSTTLSDNLAANKRNSYTYYIWVAAASAGVPMGEYSDRTSRATLNSPIPEGVTVSPNGCQSLQVTWTPRAPTPPLTLIHYRVRYRPTQGGFDQDAFIPSSESSYTITGLAPATMYTVEVRAQTELGYGGFCCTPMVSTNNVGAPRMVSLQPLTSRGAVSVDWSPPADLCGLTNPQYIIQYGTTTSSYTTHPSAPTSSPLSITGLAVGQEYFVRVAVRTQSGSGDFSSWQSVTTYEGPIPKDVTVSPNGCQSLRVTWTPQAPTALLTLIHYRVRYQAQGGSNQDAFTPSGSTYTITGLAPATSYTVMVEAQTELGYGGFCCEPMASTNNVGAPRMVSLQPLVSEGAFSVSWSPPTDLCGLTNPQYIIQYGATTSSFTTHPSMPTSSPLSITGLAVGQEYFVRVAVRTKSGSGDFSSWQSVTTYEDVGSPTIRMVTPGENFIYLEWLPPSEGSPLSYTITWTASSVTSSGPLPSTARNYTIRGLNSNTAYSGTVEVYALTNNASAGWDNCTLPQAPSNLDLVILSEASLEVKWEPAADADPSLAYTVSAEGDNVETRHANTTPGDSSVTLSGLQELTVYTVSVQAVNSGGLSRPLTATVRMVTVATTNTSNITGLSFEWTDGDFSSLQVSWDPVTAPQGGVTYHISYSPFLANDTIAKVVVTKETEDLSILLTGLDPDLFYSVMVEAIINQDVPPTSDIAVAVGASLGVIGGLAGLIVAIVLFCLLLIWCRRKGDSVNIMKRRSLHYESRKSTLGNLKDDQDKFPSSMVEENPVATIGLQSISENVYGNVDIKVHKSNSISKTMFAAHVNAMHRNRDEGFEREFEGVVNDPKASDSIARSVDTAKNRYLNTNTFDHSRVILKVPDENGCDYINASYINGYMQRSAYIASQGPTPTTISDFWQMIWDHKPAVIVMLTRVQENAKSKCEQYWHDQVDKPFDAGRDFTVVTTAYRGFADYDVRDMTVQCFTDKPHKVTHFQYTSWPDHGVPLHPSSLVKFAQEVRKVHSNSQAPMVVHCSAGVGRTGTFITLDAMMERLKEKDDLNIFEFVNEMRTRRMYMVQTMEQYVLIHDALKDYVTCGDTSVVAYQLRMAINDMEKEQDGQSGFEQQFEFLHTASRMPMGEDDVFAKRSLVAKKNRYKDKYPYSTNYLHIAGQPANNAADYINATMMASYSKRRGFIAAQSPLESTRTDVWELIWQLKTKTVVLLCPLKEEKKMSCCKFWPDESERSVKYGYLMVNHTATTAKPNWEMTTLQVLGKSKSSESPFEVTLFHFVSWPREGRPPIASLLRMMGEVEKKQKESKAPLMVMCDDGMSRTGVFVTCVSEIERVKFEGGVDIFQTVKAARTQRPHMVNTSDQYKLCFEVLQSYLDSFDDYANFKAV